MPEYWCWRRSRSSLGYTSGWGDRRLMRFRGSEITSNGGSLGYRELDDVLALTTSGGERLAEAHTQEPVRHLVVGLLRQSVSGRLPRRSSWPEDRHRPRAASAARHRARYIFEREPDLQRAGRQRLQRTFRLHALSPAIRVQPVRRSGAVRPAVRRRPQRHRPAGRSGADSRRYRYCEAALFPGDLCVPSKPRA